MVYSDGSGLDGQVGAAAVLFRNGIEVRQGRAHLGSLRRHTVYEGESAGALIGVTLLNRERTALKAATLCIDSQAAICATTATPRFQATTSWTHYILTSQLSVAATVTSSW